jgi:hypothetical protein
VPTRSTYLAATANGPALTRILSARATYSWKAEYPQATIYVPLAPQNVSAWEASTPYGVGAFVKPTSRNGHVYQALSAGTSSGSQPTWPTANAATVSDGGVTWGETGVDIVYDDVVTLTMGAGSNNVLRFEGVFRKFSYAYYPRAVGLVCYGYLIRAHEYTNVEGTIEWLGLDLATLTGSATPTDADVVKAVLTKVGVAYTAGDIGGTGVTWASRSVLNAQTFVWRAGMAASIFRGGISGVGQTALDYIRQWDMASAVYTNATSPAGFYRTYETPNGVFRSLIGGRPRNTVDLTFTEGIDIEATATSGREYPKANACYVQGADFGVAGANPVRNSAGSLFVGQQSNPFQPNTRPVPYQFSSPFIEWGLEADGGVGMNCERVANALLVDLNRETVTVAFRTPRDELIVPGMTILVQGPGGQPDRLGIGEQLWVDEVTAGVEENGSFYQDVTGTGGGLPDDYTPAPDG